MSFLRSLLLVPLALAAAPALALDPALAPHRYVRDHWTTANGLPQNSVTAITQTRDGYLWLGTFGGLTRFDGVRFASSQEAGAGELAVARILALLEDREGALWIGTEERGVGRLRDGRLELYGVAEGLPDPLVWTLYEDAHGTLWAGTTRGLARFAEGRFVTEPLPAELGVPVVVALAEDAAGQLWIGTINGLALRAGGKVRLVHGGAPPAFEVHALAAEDDGSIWVRTREALVRFRDGRQIEQHQMPLPGGAIAAPVLRDRDGSLWFSGEGLARHSQARIERLTRADGLPGDLIRALYEDAEGGLWVGLDGGGLVRLRDANVEAWDERDGLPLSILPIVEDRDGTLWAGGSCGGLLRRNGAGFSEVHRPDGRSYGCVSALLAASDGSLWVAANAEVIQLAAGAERVFADAGGAATNSVRALLEDGDGAVWVGTREGLARFHDGAWRRFTRADGLVSDDIRILELDRDGALWIGAWGGVSRLAGDRFESWGEAEGMPDAAVRSLWQSGDGAMWAGTYGGGLARIAGRAVARYDAAAGFPDPVVSRILEDGRGDVWLSGLRGIARLPRGQLEELGGGRRAAVEPTLFGVEDGMRSVECNGGGQPAGWRARDGRLLFPTVQGIAVIDPAHMHRIRLPPPVHVEAALVNRQPVDLRRPLELPPGRTEIEIRYTAVSFTAPERARFRYRLEGYDADWVEAGTRRTAYFTNVPPGKYRFVVRAANADGIWNESGASLELALRPTFFQTLWFPLSLGVALAAAGGGAASWWLRHLRRRKRELERLVDERTRDLVELNANLEQRVSDNTVEIRATRDMALVALARLAELRDSTTAEHLERIGAYSERLAEAARAGLPDDTIDDEFIAALRRSSPLHDIGKVAIPDAILRKPGGLTAEEAAVMQTHTTIGGDTLREVLRSYRGPSFLEMAMVIAYSHHERWDGSGYPQRLAGDAIPLPARIVALVDAYDALTSVRPYKPAFSHQEAVRRILADRGSHFDPALVDAFAAIAPELPEIRRTIDGAPPAAVN